MYLRIKNKPKTSLPELEVLGWGVDVDGAAVPGTILLVVAVVVGAVTTEEDLISSKSSSGIDLLIGYSQSGASK